MTDAQQDVDFATCAGHRMNGLVRLAETITEVIKEGSAAMRFSLYLNAQTRGPHEDVEIIQTLTRQAREATDAGFDGVTLTEHHFSGYNTYGDNFMFASHLIPQVRPEVTFSIAVAVPPLHNPLQLAERVNLLDVLAKGRVIVGFAPGGSPVEYAGLGRDPNTRHEMMYDNLDIMERALQKQLSEPAFEWQTQFESGVLHTRIMPGSFSGEQPRFARATQNIEGIRWTGERGWYLFTAREVPDAVGEYMRTYEESLRASGATEDTVQERLDWSMLQKQIYVADSNEQAEREIRERLVLMAENQARSFSLVRHVKGSEHLKSVVGVSPRDPDEFIRKALIIGDPDSVAAQLRDYRAAGVRHMSLLFNFGFMSAETSDRSLRLFIDNVLPAFRADSASRPRAQFA